MFRKNTAGQFLSFQGVDATTGGIKSGVTWTIRRCIDGTFAAGGGTVTEDSTNGWYKYAMSQADTNGNDISFNFTGTGAVPQTVNIVTTACDPTVATNFGITALPATAVTSNASLITSGSGTDQLTVSGGIASSDAKKINAVSTSSVTTINANLGTTQAMAFNANNFLKVSLNDILATTLTETSGQLAGGFKKFFNVATPASTMELITAVATVNALATDSVNANALATDAVNEIRNAITGGAYALDTDANGHIRIVDGTGAGEIDTSAGAIAHVILTDTLTTYTGNTPQTGDSFARIGATGSGLTTLATAASITALNNLSTAQVLAQVETALATTTRTLPGQATPSQTPTIAAMIEQLYKLAINPSDQNAMGQKHYASNGTTIDQKRTISDDGTTFAFGALVTGP